MTARTSKLPSLLVVVVLMPAALSFAELTPLGDEFQVNTTSPVTDTHPKVAMDENANFVVVWRHSDDSELQLLGQRFDRDGMKIGDEFQINTTEVRSAPNFDVAMDRAGSFVVVWEQAGGPNEHIRARIYDSDGTPSPIGEFRVNDDGSGFHTFPTVAFSDFGFAVAWSGHDQEVGDNLSVRTFGTGGGIPAPEQQFFYPVGINNPDIAGNADGEFVVAWAGFETEDFMQLRDIYALHFDADAKPVGDRVRTNTFIFSDQREPRSAMNKDGESVVVWKFGPDNDASAQAFDNTATPAGDETVLTDEEFGTPTNLGVVMDSDTFTLAYEIFVSGPGAKIQGTRFTTGAGRIGDVFPIHPSPPASRNPSIAHDGASRYITVYDLVSAPASIAARFFTSGASTTTTTTPSSELCGDADGNGSITATDALIALSTAVSSASCPLCICDVDSSGMVTAADALRTLNSAVGLGAVLTCVAC